MQENKGIGQLVFNVFVIVMIVSILIYTHIPTPQQEQVTTREIISLCSSNFNVKPRLDESLNEIRFIGNGDIKSLDDAKSEIKILRSELQATNQQYNKLETLVGCIFDKH